MGSSILCKPAIVTTDAPGMAEISSDNSSVRAHPGGHWRPLQRAGDTLLGMWDFPPLTWLIFQRDSVLIMDFKFLHKLFYSRSDNSWSSWQFLHSPRQCHYIKRSRACLIQGSEDRTYTMVYAVTQLWRCYTTSLLYFPHQVNWDCMMYLSILHGSSK